MVGSVHGYLNYLEGIRGGQSERMGLDVRTWCVDIIRTEYGMGTDRVPNLTEHTVPDFGLVCLTLLPIHHVALEYLRLGLEFQP